MSASKCLTSDSSVLTRERNTNETCLAHLLPGKVVFNQVFAPDIGSAAKNNVTKSLKTAGGGLALLLCNEHPPSPDKEHHPLINGKARVLKSDIEGKNSVIQVIDTVLIP
jgi:uncharacterized surface protein with fasciclin (FAS1) repeats